MKKLFLTKVSYEDSVSSGYIWQLWNLTNNKLLFEHDERLEHNIPHGFTNNVNGVIIDNVDKPKVVNVEGCSYYHDNEIITVPEGTVIDNDIEIIDYSNLALNDLNKIDSLKARKEYIRKIKEKYERVLNS